MSKRKQISQVEERRIEEWRRPKKVDLSYAEACRAFSEKEEVTEREK
jgi:hypothetical protein